MKTLLNLLLFFSTFLFFSFISNYTNYQTECVSIDSDGYMNIKIWDTKKGINYKPEQARKDAIHSLLFSGISGINGCATQPPILSKIEEQDSFKSIEKSFFSSNGKWARFTTSSATETTLPLSLGDKNWKVYEVKVSKNELRKYLVDLKIIKSLNNGF